jgi:hypothetical protein
MTNSCSLKLDEALAGLEVLGLSHGLIILDLDVSVLRDDYGSRLSLRDAFRHSANEMRSGEVSMALGPFAGPGVYIAM